MDLHYKTYGQEVYSVNSKEVEDILPYEGVLRLPNCKSPYQGLLMRRGQMLQVLGPIPADIEQRKDTENYTARPWVIVYKTHAQVVEGLPEIQERAS